METHFNGRSIKEYRVKIMIMMTTMQTENCNCLMPHDEVEFNVTIGDIVD